MKLIKPEFQIKPESAALAGAVERLYVDLFVPARFHKAFYQFRDGVASVNVLIWFSLVGDRLERVYGAINNWMN